LGSECHGDSSHREEYVARFMMPGTLVLSSEVNVELILSHLMREMLVGGSELTSRFVIKRVFGYSC
jgi:hypothetical protein